VKERWGVLANHGIPGYHLVSLYGTLGPYGPCLGHSGLDTTTKLGTAFLADSPRRISLLCIRDHSSHVPHPHTLHLATAAAKRKLGVEHMKDWLYLIFLLSWALSIIGIQWVIGWRHLWRERNKWPWIILGLSIYFTLADSPSRNLSGSSTLH